MALFVLKEKGAGLQEVTQQDKVSILLDFVRAVQEEAYPEIVQTLQAGEQFSKKWPHKDMGVYLDDKGLLRARGRYPDNSSTPEPPLLLPHEHNLTKLMSQTYTTSITTVALSGLCSTSEGGSGVPG